MHSDKAKIYIRKLYTVYGTFLTAAEHLLPRKIDFCVCRCFLAAYSILIWTSPSIAIPPGKLQKITQ